jgi:hypothetical protein
MLKSFFQQILFIGITGTSLTAFGHANVVPKDNNDDFSNRQYEEATTAYLNLNIAHACKVGPDGIERRNTKHFAVVFPNNIDLTGIAATFDRQGNQYAGNVLMTIKPSVDSDWKKIRTQRGSVPTYYSHGSNSNDVRGIQWQHGDVPDSMYDNLEIRASLPKLQGCVSKLQVYLPSVQYCANDTMQAWIKYPTDGFPDDVIAHYSAYFDILRNEEKNPLPAGCSEGVNEVIYPEAEDIDKFLKLKLGKGR